MYRIILLAALMAVMLLGLQGIAFAQPGVNCGEGNNVDLTPAESHALALADSDRDSDNDGWACENEIVGGVPDQSPQEFFGDDYDDLFGTGDDADDAPETSTATIPTRIDTGAGGSAASGLERMIAAAAGLLALGGGTLVARRLARLRS